MNDIKFSIITTNYNDAEFLPRNFTSVKAQNYSNYEHILIDDGSSDQSISVINTYLNESSKVKLLIHDKNLGPAAGVGTGISNATGSFSTFLSADDELDSSVLEIISKVIANDKNAKLICGDVVFINPDGSQFQRSFYRSKVPVYFSPKRVMELMRKGVFIINGGGSFVHISELIKTPYNDPRLEWHCDILAYSLIGLKNGFWYIPSPLHKFHIRNNNFSFGAKNWSLQEHVIKYSLDLLNSTIYNSSKSLIIESSYFASYPYILRFLLKNYKSYKDFFTFNLFINALTITILRKLRNITPRVLINYYNNIKSFTLQK